MWKVLALSHGALMYTSSGSKTNEESGAKASGPSVSVSQEEFPDIKLDKMRGKINSQY